MMSCKNLLVFIITIKIVLLLSPLQQNPQILSHGIVSLIHGLTQASDHKSASYQIAQHYLYKNKQIVFGVRNIQSPSLIQPSFGKKTFWQIKLINASSGLILELTAGPHNHWKLQVSYLIWDNSFSQIFPINQNVKLGVKPSMKKISQDYILAFKNQQGEIKEELQNKKQLIPISFLRGFQIKEGWKKDIKVQFRGGFMRQKGVIEFINQLKGISYCYITILVINLKALNKQNIILKYNHKNHLSQQINEGRIDLLRYVQIRQEKLLSKIQFLSQRIHLEFIEMKCPINMDLDINTQKCLSNTQAQEQEYKHMEILQIKKLSYARFLKHTCAIEIVPCPSTYNYATKCKMSKNCKILISQCQNGWYTTADLVLTCTICPSSLTFCIDCGLQFGSSKVICNTCQSGKIPLNGVCANCPVGCATCQLASTGITCLTCLSNLILKNSGTIKTCSCLSNQYLATTPSIQCINCAIHCLKCTSTACTQCSIGYALVNSTCSACMQVCKTCSNNSTCDSCIDSTYVMISNVCQCISPLFYNTITNKCQSCTTIQANCQNCIYSSAYIPSNPPIVICSQAKPSYYILPSGSTNQCMNFCTNCTPSNLICVQCNINFIYTTSCICNNTYFFNNITSTCELCDDVIDGCTSCNTQPIPNPTTCQNCDIGYYILSVAYPVDICYKCPSLCVSCNNATDCINCINNLVPINIGFTNICGCNGSDYLDPQTLSCKACNEIINNCQICLADSSGASITCGSCNNNYYPTSSGLTCVVCPLQCATCSNETTCTLCQDGFQLFNGTCICNSTCNDCLTNINSTGNCIACTTFPSFTCNQCQPGYYQNSSNCISCINLLPNCLECTVAVCLTCTNPFIYFDAIDICDCNNTNNFYITNSLPSSCDLCQNIILNCISCQNKVGSTQCLVCDDGYYLNSSKLSCQPCSLPCKTCDVTDMNCTSCQSTYVWVSLNVCGCQETSQFFYNPEILGCSPCSILYDNCNNCQNNGTLQPVCQICNNPYYFNSTSFKCQICPNQCLSCTSPTVCTGCNFNFVLSQSIGLSPGACVCNNSAIPSNYYDSITKMCRTCEQLITNCISCSYNSSLQCNSCKLSTYLLGNQCISCPSQCATCNNTHCLSCPLDSTLDDEGNCVCENNCLHCFSSSLNCLQCTFVANVLSVCSSCLAGYFPSGTSCLMCPSTCITCSSSISCTTCYPTYIIDSVGICSCDISVGLFPSNEVCKLCDVVIYACKTCDIDSSSKTICISCIDGYFVSNDVCHPCDSNCLTCSISSISCTSCRKGEILLNNTCSCGSNCLICNTYSQNCSSCIYDIFGSFVKCEICQSGFYLNGLNCSICNQNCVSCTTGGQCASCQYLYQIINGTCQCNSQKNMWESGGTCQFCNNLYPNCQSCIHNTSQPLNVSCASCQFKFYELNNSCIPSVCPDGIITSGEYCDDNNSFNGDGCNMFCQTQQNFVCQGEPSICVMQLNYSITPDSIIVNPVVCNQVKVNFQMEPIYEAYKDVNFKDMLSHTNNNYVFYLSWSYDHKSGIVSYNFDYKQDLNKRQVNFYFQPKKLNINQTKKIPIIVVTVYFISSNNLGIIYYAQEVCQNKKALQTVTSVVQYASYATLILTALPCKIVGLEWFGVLQLAHLSIGNMDKVNTLLTPLMGLKNVHGAALKIDDKQEAAGQRRLQSTNIITPDRVKSIGYSSNFLRNCNLMFIIVVSILMVSFILYICSYLCQKCAPILYSFSRRIFKQIILTLILFNCYNFAYSAGLHFQYAQKNDSLYLLGTLAAVLSLVLPLIICLTLSFSSQDGFGQYKDKLKTGVIEKAYFIITIMYRTGTGLYVATMNESQLSSLIVIALAILFLLYNLVNLPFIKAYHNYRANICHITQFICLFVTLYYRSMMSNKQYVDVAVKFTPVYIEYSFILLSFVVTLIVLIYEIYIFVKNCFKSQKKTNEQKQNTEQHELKNSIVGQKQNNSNWNINQKYIYQYD